MLIEKLDGEPIQVVPTPQHGSIFFFKIPIYIHTAESKEISIEGMAEDSIDLPNERAKGEKKLRESKDQFLYAQVLIVDDGPFNRLVLRKILETAGYTYAEASTGIEAVSMMRAAWDRGKPYSVVLMDIEMPEMDGITATRELLGLAASGVLGSAPVIIGCSAFSSQEDRATALAAGMSHYLEKPISRGRLLELVSAYYHP